MTSMTEDASRVSLDTQHASAADADASVGQRVHSAPTGSASPNRRRIARIHGGQLGTGLTWTDLLLLTLTSIGLFIVYPTVLWNAPAGSAHVGRFVVSYLAVVPLAAALLYYRIRRVPIAELSAAVLIVWSIKMIVTVGLYHGLASKTRVVLEPPAPPQTFVHAEGHTYRPVPGFVGRTVAGRVVDAGGAPVAGAIVVLAGLAEGRPLPADAAEASIRVQADGLVPALQVVPFGAPLRVENRSKAMAVVSGEHDGRTVYNIPVVPGEDHRPVRMNKLGLIEFSLRIGTAGAKNWVMVVDHPYYALTDADGRFELADVPADAVEVRALQVPAVVGNEEAGRRLLTTSATAAASADDSEQGTPLRLVF